MPALRGHPLDDPPAGGLTIFLSFGRIKWCRALRHFIRPKALQAPFYSSKGALHQFIPLKNKKIVGPPAAGSSTRPRSSPREPRWLDFNPGEHHRLGLLGGLLFQRCNGGSGRLGPARENPPEIPSRPSTAAAAGCGSSLGSGAGHLRKRMPCALDSTRSQNIIAAQPGMRLLVIGQPGNVSRAAGADHTSASLHSREENFPGLPPIYELSLHQFHCHCYCYCRRH